MDFRDFKHVKGLTERKTYAALKDLYFTSLMQEINAAIGQQDTRARLIIDSSPKQNEDAPTAHLIVYKKPGPRYMQKSDPELLRFTIVEQGLYVQAKAAREDILISLKDGEVPRWRLEYFFGKICEWLNPSLTHTGQMSAKAHKCDAA